MLQSGVTLDRAAVMKYISEQRASQSEMLSVDMRAS